VDAILQFDLGYSIIHSAALNTIILGYAVAQLV
jgi:hypothetical protein